MISSSFLAGVAGRATVIVKSRHALLARAGGVCLLALSLNAGAADVNDWWFYVKNDRYHQIEPLVQSGVDPNRVSPDGQPTIVEAVRNKAWKTFDALASNPKVNIEAANQQGETALMLLAVLGETDRARKLLDRGAQVNRLGWTPLHYAASRARLDTAKLLIARKAIINAPSPDGTTPLMMAALSKNDAMVSLLVEAGADATTRNLSNLSAADWARSADATRIANRLDELAKRQSQQRGSAARPNESGAGASSGETGSAYSKSVTNDRGARPTSEPPANSNLDRASEGTNAAPRVLRGVSGVQLGGD